MHKNLLLITYRFCLSYSVIFYLFVLINGASPLMDYAYTKTEQCGSRSSLFLSFRGISLGLCLTECGKRSKCVAINYRKRYDNLCELLADTSFLSKSDDCMYIRRNEMNFSGSAVDSCACSIGQTCDLDTRACSKIECDPIDLHNGHIIGNRYTIGSSLRVKCAPDYREENNVTTITCLSTGYWSSVPSCVLKECQPFTVDNGLMIGNNFRIGSSLTVTCNTDYEEENSVTMVTCLSSSVWDYTPNCVLKQCQPVTVDNGVTSGNDLRIGSSLTVTCNTDYEEENGVTMITCLSPSVWDYSPNCVQKQCQPFTIENGLTGGNDLRIGSSLTVTCNTDYEEANGVTIVTCLSSYVWDYTPNCVLKPCTSDWVQLDDSCYYISDQSVSRNSAENKCGNIGGTLAKLDTSRKTNFIIEEISALSSRADSYWILLKKSRNSWNWDSGVELSGYDDWGYGQPETKGEKCVYLWGPDSYQWHDAMCGWDAHYICEKPTYS